MKKIVLVISLVISLALCSSEKTDFIREVLAKNDGFAQDDKTTILYHILYFEFTHPDLSLSLL